MKKAKKRTYRITDEKVAELLVKYLSPLLYNTGVLSFEELDISKMVELLTDAKKWIWFIDSKTLKQEIQILLGNDYWVQTCELSEGSSDIHTSYYLTLTICDITG